MQELSKKDAEKLAQLVELARRRGNKIFAVASDMDSYIPCVTLPSVQIREHDCAGETDLSTEEFWEFDEEDYAEWYQSLDDVKRDTWYWQYSSFFWEDFWEGNEDTDMSPDSQTDYIDHALYRHLFLS